MTRGGPPAWDSAQVPRNHSQVTVIVNPIKVDIDEARATLNDVAASAGLSDPRLVETTEDDPGFGQARQALADGAELICALGGDGTVRAVAQMLVGTGVPLGLLPGGTGNLLARNLDGAVDALAEAAAIALTGRDRTIDVGWMVLDPREDQRSGIPRAAENVHCFTVMAGLGFDAQMMADAPEDVKDKAGWAAYVASGGKHLTDAPFTVDLAVDGRRATAGKARTVVVGNCGELTGGMVLLPDAVVDDGRLDVASVSPGNLGGWIGVAARVLGKGDDGQSLERFSGEDITVRVDPPQLSEVDGDVLIEAAEIRFVVQPRSLVVRVGS